MSGTTTGEGVTVQVESTSVDVLEVHRLAVIGAVTAKLVHNLNNPLTLIKANVAHLRSCLAAGEASGELAEVGPELVTEMQDALAEIRSVISTVGGYATADADSAEVDLGEVVEVGCAIAGIKARFSADLRYTPPEVPVPVLGRGGQLQQLVASLVLHATAQPSSYGPIEVTVGVVGDRAFILVEDLRPPGVVTHVPDGSHHEDVDPEVGLLLARHIAADHGGSLEVADDGGRYRVELPSGRCAPSGSGE